MNHFFTYEQGNLLIRLLLAHILSDFVFQPSNISENKTWFSTKMLVHVVILFLTTLAFSFSIQITLVIVLLHWIIDGIKNHLIKRNFEKKYFLFVFDQAAHVIVILIVWCWRFALYKPLYKAILMPLLNYEYSLVILAYAIVIWPVGYVLKLLLRKMLPSELSQNNRGVMEDGGKLIGQFERIIILTFVLLGQYEAIGFLITGKGIIRFAQRDENIKSEYVLVGTIMSYAISIVVGAFINWMIRL